MFFLPVASCAQKVNWPIVPSATDFFSLAMTRACRSVGLSSSDLSFRDDYLPTDSLRLSSFDRWFQQPLVMPGELDRSSKKLLQNSWQSRLEVLAEYGDLEISSEPRPTVEPGLRGSMASYWKDRRLPPSYRHALRKLEKSLPSSAKDWLLHLVLLDITIAASRSDGLDSLSQEEKAELAQSIVQLYPSLDGDEPDLPEEEMERVLDLLDKAQWRDFEESALSELAPRLDALFSCPVPTEEETADLRGLLLDWQAPWGRLLVGGVDSQVYEIEWDGRLLILDLGGDDVYHVTQRGRRAGQFEYIVDLGGNDRYEAVGSFGFGATLGGVSLLYDHAGNDQYEGTAPQFWCWTVRSGPVHRPGRA